MDVSDIIYILLLNSSIVGLQNLIYVLKTDTCKHLSNCKHSLYGYHTLEGIIATPKLFSILDFNLFCNIHR